MEEVEVDRPGALCSSVQLSRGNIQSGLFVKAAVMQLFSAASLAILL